MLKTVRSTLASLALLIAPACAPLALSAALAAVPAQPTITTYSLTGSTTGPFSTVWSYVLTGDVRVAIDTGAGLTPVNPSSYTLAATAPVTSGGTVTLSSGVVPAGGWPPGSTLVLQRISTDDQPSAFGQMAGFSPKSSEQALDHVERQVQEGLSAQVLDISMPPGSSGYTLPGAPARAGMTLGFDANGDPRMLAPVPGPVGPAGPVGPPGTSIASGVGAPAAGVGANGDFYIDTAASCLYGPKAGGAWPSVCTQMAEPGVTYAPLASPAFTGAPTAPSPALGSNSSQIATTASVRAEIMTARGFVSPMEYGCAGDGVTDDTACFSAALKDSIGQNLVLGGHCYVITAPLAPSGSVHIVGSSNVVSDTEPEGDAIQQSCIRAGVANLNLLTLVGGSSVEGVQFDMSGGSRSLANTSGAAITLPWGVKGNSYITLRDVSIYMPCIGVDIESKFAILDSSKIELVQPNCYGIIIGRDQVPPNDPIDDRITNTTIIGNQPPGGQMAAALAIYDTGGSYVSNNDFLYGQNGTELIPGSNQLISWFFGSNTVLGDTVTGAALLIDPSASSGSVWGFQCTGCWAAGVGTGPAVSIVNDGAGTIAGVHFVGLRVLAGQNGIYAGASALTGLTVDSSVFCKDGEAGGDVIYLASGIIGASFRNNLFGGTACEGYTGVNPPNVGIQLFGNRDVMISGNDFTGIPVPIAGVPTLGSYVGGNIGVDTVIITQAAASIIQLTVNPITALTGSASVSSMGGGWSGRVATLIATSPSITFVTGGNICTPMTATENVPIMAVFNGSCWYLK